MALKLHETEVIKAPVISEKSNFLASAKNTYTFEVDKSADKLQIKAAIEKIYSNVRVVDVRTVNVPGKPRRTRSGEKDDRRMERESRGAVARGQQDRFVLIPGTRDQSRRTLSCRLKYTSQDDARTPQQQRECVHRDHEDRTGKEPD